MKSKKSVVELHGGQYRGVAAIVKVNGGKSAILVMEDAEDLCMLMEYKLEIMADPDKFKRVIVGDDATAVVKRGFRPKREPT